jgi:hypothetical protein
MSATLSSINNIVIVITKEQHTGKFLGVQELGMFDVLNS